MNSERFRQIEKQELSFQRRCALTGLAVIATSIGAVTAGSVREAFFHNTQPQENERNEQSYETGGQSKNDWDETNVLLIVGGAAGIGVGPFIIALPGSQAKVRMGL